MVNEFKVVKPPRFWSTAFNLYKTKRIELFKQENATISLRDEIGINFLKQCDEEWTLLTDDESDQYLNLEKVDKERYEKEKIEYNLFRQSIKK